MLDSIYHMTLNYLKPLHFWRQNVKTLRYVILDVITSRYYIILSEGFQSTLTTLYIYIVNQLSR